MIESVKIGGAAMVKFNLNQLLSKTSLSETETEVEEVLEVQQEPYKIKLISSY